MNTPRELTAIESSLSADVARLNARVAEYENAMRFHKEADGRVRAELDRMNEVCRANQSTVDLYKAERDALEEACKEAWRVICWAAQESQGKVRKEIVGGWIHHAARLNAAIAKSREGQS